MSKLRLVEPSYKLSTYGFRAFSVCAPRLWNGIPLEIRQSNSVSVFKKIFFCEAFCPIVI